MATFKPKVTLLIIDPQNDFHPGGSLQILTALSDSERIADLLQRYGDEITDIIVTLDSHHRTHIAHAIFWTNSNNEEPAPFTQITHQDIIDGKWLPKDIRHLEHCKYYTSELEKKGRFVLCIWPEHCLIGTNGHAIVTCLNDALQEWCGKNLNTIQYVMKGTNCMVEMYSALAAEVELPSDITTQIDPTLIERLNESDKLIICGQALSHCVNFTTRDILKYWKKPLSQIYILEDCSSPVQGFEDASRKFIQEMTDSGVTVTNSIDIINSR